MKKRLSLIIFMLIPLAVGFLSAVVTQGGIAEFESLNKAPLTPQASVFPIVWTILYTLMGISSWIIATSDAPVSEKRSALIIYGIQLAVNFFWSVIFFNNKMYLSAFFWLAFLWIWIIIMIKEFYKISPKAAYLQIPYLIWVTFAGYLNLAIYFLN